MKNNNHHYEFEIIIRCENGSKVRTDYTEFFFDDEKIAWKNAVFIATEKVWALGSAYIESITRIAQ